MEVIGLKKEKMGFEETELRLGLPGINGSGTAASELGDVVIRKRGFCETETDQKLTTVDLKLNLSSKEATTAGGAGPSPTHLPKDNTLLHAADPAKPPAKAQVVGWPPVRSFMRRNNMLAESEKKSSNPNARFVKVSMDGAPYLRKVDLKMYNSYRDLSDSLGNMFSSQGILKDFMNQSKLMDLLNSSDYVPTYEDKDRDWMLLGDVPWEMFVDSCKRLRIMKGKEAIGLAPRAMEKFKSRS